MSKANIHMRDPAYAIWIDNGKKLKRPLCSLAWLESKIVSTKWENVNCKKCLKFKKQKDTKCKETF